MNSRHAGLGNDKAKGVIMAIDIIGVGYPFMDCLIQMSELPKSNGASDLLDYSWQGGGMVATGLVAASVLGASCSIIGVVGGDQHGLFCKNDLKRDGVDVSHLIIDINGTTDLSFVLSESLKSARSFISRRGSRRKLLSSDLEKGYIAGAKYLLVSAMDPVSVCACKIARENGVKVVIDADIYDLLIVEHIGVIDVFIGSEDFYVGMFSDNDYETNCRKLASLGPKIAMITLGQRGCTGIYEGAYMKLPAFHVKVVDANGAGDVYHGAFIYGMLQGWEGRYVAEFASAVSAIKCTRLGGRAGIPHAAVAEGFMRNGEIDYTEIDKRVDMYRKGTL
jgi:sulfofructose kinase